MQLLGFMTEGIPPVLCMIFILLDIIILAAMTVNAISS